MFRQRYLKTRYLSSRFFGGPLGPVVVGETVRILLVFSVANPELEAGVADPTLIFSVANPTLDFWFQEV